MNYGLKSFDGNHSLPMTSEPASRVRGSWQAIARTLPTELNARNSTAAWALVLLHFYWEYLLSLSPSEFF